jgi:hypothetical protein
MYCRLEIIVVVVVVLARRVWSASPLVSRSSSSSLCHINPRKAQFIADVPVRWCISIKFIAMFVVIAL